MTFLQSILLGLIQGVAEFLPISSSGHLAIAQNLLNINAEVPAFYDVLLHLGTLAAVILLRSLLTLLLHWEIDAEEKRQRECKEAEAVEAAKLPEA